MDKCLEELCDEEITERLDRVYGESGGDSSVEEELGVMQRRSVDWEDDSL